jgi:hypothetical protein
LDRILYGIVLAPTKQTKPRHCSEMFGRLRGSEEKRMEFRVINNSHTELQNLSIIAVVVIDSIN